MMGTKERAFAPLCNRSVEDLVPADNFYRHLEAKLDLGIAYHVLDRRTTYEDLGPQYFDRRDRTAVERRLVGRLESLGYKVTIEPITPAA